MRGPGTILTREQLKVEDVEVGLGFETMVGKADGKGEHGCLLCEHDGIRIVSIVEGYPDVENDARKKDMCH